jgi:ABC-type Mn2+/Zn2+ transport system permease subunit
MTDFLAVLSFAAVPLIAALLFAVVLPPLGAALHLRNESLLGIALPPAGTALLAVAAALHDNHGQGQTLFDFFLVACGLSILVALLPPGAGPRKTNLRTRALILAVMFSVANASLLLVMALSTHARAELLHALNGEMLAVSPGAVVATALGVVAVGLLFVRFRGHVLAYLLDEETYRVRFSGARLLGLAFPAAAVLSVTAAVLLEGPILATGLLVIPALLTERRSRGLLPYLLTSMMVGVVGTFAGFIVALVVDLPPAPTAVAGVLLVGLAWRFGSARR